MKRSRESLSINYCEGLRGVFDGAPIIKDGPSNFPRVFGFRRSKRRAVMSRLRLVLFSSGLIALAAIVLSCGSPSGHPLQSISLSPTAADAQDYPNGQVPFVVTGYYPTPPMTVTPVAATWGACFQSAPTTQVSVSNTGIAQCGSEASGTYTVFANDPLPPGTYSCPAEPAPCGGGCVLSATAQLTCP